jgi:hemin uptake protein HemP
MNTHNPSAFSNRMHRRVTEADIQTQPRRLSVRTVTSQSLFLGEHEIGIEHAGSLYRLKITRQGKLILNK